jgi:hypothetical protein
MPDLVGLNWGGYFRTLQDDDLRALATWLAAQRLQVGEFMEVVDLAYAKAPARWQGKTHAFVKVIGRPAASSYARRKRHFGKLMLMLEAAMMSGALPGEVSPEELDLPVPIQAEPLPVAELVSALERVSHAGE